MRLNHLDLAVPDVALARDFFTSHFGLRHRETLGCDGLAILADDSGLVLVLSRWRKRGAAAYPDGFHIEIQPPSAMRGGWMFYLTGPGGVLIEVSWRPAPAGD